MLTGADVEDLGEGDLRDEPACTGLVGDAFGALPGACPEQELTRRRTTAPMVNRDERTRTGSTSHQSSGGRQG